MIHFYGNHIKENNMSEKIRQLYDARLSIKENAERCGVTVNTMRNWLQINHVDRQYEAQLIKYKAVKKYQRRNLTAQKIAEKTGFSLNTVKKYMRMVAFTKKGGKNKSASFDITNNETIIKSVSYDQQQILNWIIKLYVPTGFFDADFTFSIGAFYKGDRVPSPRLRFDKFPDQADNVKPLIEAEHIEDGSLRSCVVDLPFLITQKKWAETSLIANRFNFFESFEEVTEANQYMLNLAYRKLCKKGVLVLKTQDQYTGGRHIWMHRFVEEWAEATGFKLTDMFILLAKKRTLSGGLTQNVARKFHSYFFVFRK